VQCLIKRPEGAIFRPQNGQRRAFPPGHTKTFF
jgi:hypothetical protein